MLVALDEHENHRAFGARAVWLMRVFCGSRVLGTDMRGELLVAFLLEPNLHLVNRFANERG
jgi:hypothetical protein